MIRSTTRNLMVLLLLAAQPATAFDFCPNAFFYYDDGFWERYPTHAFIEGTIEYAMFFDLFAGTLDEICMPLSIYSGLVTPAPLTDVPVTLTVYDDDGPGGTPGTVLDTGTFTTTIARIDLGNLSEQVGVDDTFQYTCLAVVQGPPTDGTFFVSVAVDIVDQVAVWADTTGPTETLGYYSVDGGAWTDMRFLFASFKTFAFRVAIGFPPEDEIFSDGFESGDVCNWSAPACG